MVGEGAEEKEEDKDEIARHTPVSTVTFVPLRAISMRVACSLLEGFS